MFESVNYHSNGSFAFAVKVNYWDGRWMEKWLNTKERHQIINIRGAHCHSFNLTKTCSRHCKFSTLSFFVVLYLINKYLQNCKYTKNSKFLRVIKFEEPLFKIDKVQKWFWIKNGPFCECFLIKLDSGQDLIYLHWCLLETYLPVVRVKMK